MADTPRRRRWPLVLATAGAASVAVLAACEAQGWSFLGRPAQQWLSARLDRPVQLVDASGTGFRLQLWRGIHLSVQQLRVDNPAWAGPGPLALANGLQLRLRWRDALAWRPGRALALQSLTLSDSDLQLQRLADGRANWALATAPTPAPTANPPPRALSELLTVQQLALGQGRLRWQDAPLGLQLDAQVDQRAPTDGQPGALTVQASGRYRDRPVRATLQAGSPAGWLADAQALDAAVPMTLSVQAGRASLGFVGQVSRLLGDAPEVLGRYSLSGPSLAAVGEPLGITLPATRRFDMRGQLQQTGPRWRLVVEQATVGASRLAGAFVYDRRAGQVPLLQGRLTGPALLLQDLGPAVGAPIDIPNDTPNATPNTTPRSATSARANGRVLPDRPFSLPALRAMDAEVLVDLDRLDFGTTQLQSAAPLRGLVRLRDGVLDLDQLQATLAQGQLSGHLRLDGRQAPARWEMDLRARQVQIAQAFPAARRVGPTPHISGLIDGRLTLSGRGNSTAQLLASADGQLRLHWRDGQLSHLLVEAAGLDIAQALGVLVRGDRPLPVTCGAADVRIQAGRATPQVLLVDTRDSLLWVDGSLSLATEQLQLQAHVRPKDFSPLTLRTPLHIDGMLGAPVLSLDKPRLLQRAVPAALLALVSPLAGLLQRAVPAALLALVSPLAGLLPLLDAGDDDGPATGGCQALVRQFKASGLGVPRP